ncbi:UDP-N-acetylglucosamine/UDP-N-acetylgalactosaminediphosphorylase [Raineyella antarctica]|uniref:UDP-N-acetylglucosamine/UDP-N-acetylgalactosamine diphosphorylase n=1 Tax=Raineyella antarctica TaxID=1577474 RepID=A0A1G6H763_9ACTN|nr:UDP-N-acetylglucosamine/UDP-N-acetylgalactosaminediphosphorylase [Raineyella antarctica]
MIDRPRGFDKAMQLIERGVEIPNPWSLDIGDDVDIDRISADGVTIHPGCRIHGAATVISAGVTLGEEGPVTLKDCRLGPNVRLKGGYFADSVYLDGANMGLGAHVREGTLLEEQAGGAHTVGLKQTILFPYVTLGSLINFCDCLMAGGTSRKDHSEVGSSYIHFNFTPDGNKTTPSLFGDVARGVMLDQPAIFLGGQGGTVGPVRVGYGTVVGAGSILREDVEEDGLLVLSAPPEGLRRPNSPRRYKRLRQLLEKNLCYLANLGALEAWYREVRAPFFAAQEFGGLVLEGALEMLASARKERTKRIDALVATLTPDSDDQRQLVACIVPLLGSFDPAQASAELTSAPAEVDTAVAAAAAAGTGYLAAIAGLSPEVKQAGTAWLQSIVDDTCARAAACVPDMGLFESA